MTPPTSPTANSYTGARPDIIRHVPVDAVRILDIGCSNGELGASLKKLKGDREVDGIDYNRHFCELAAERLDRVYNVDLNVSRISAITSGRIYDCMIFADSLEHLVAPEEVLKDALTRLTRSGTVIICIPNIRHISAAWSIFVRGTFPRRRRGLFDRTHIRWFTRSDLRDLAYDAGLRHIETFSTLRVFDQPGGRVNQWASRLSAPLEKVSILSELLGYQHILIGKFNRQDLD